MRHIWLMIKVLPVLPLAMSEGPKLLLNSSRWVGFIAVDCFLSWSCECRRGRHQDAISFLTTLQSLTAPSTLIVCGALRTPALPTSHFLHFLQSPLPFLLLITSVSLPGRPGFGRFLELVPGLPVQLLLGTNRAETGTWAVGTCRLSAGHGSAHTWQPATLGRCHMPTHKSVAPQPSGSFG